MPASENHGRLFGFRFHDKLRRSLCSESLQECKWREVHGSVTVDDTRVMLFLVKLSVRIKMHSLWGDTRRERHWVWRRRHDAASRVTSQPEEGKYFQTGRINKHAERGTYTPRLSSGGTSTSLFLEKTTFVGAFWMTPSRRLSTRLFHFGIWRSFDVINDDLEMT